MITVTVSRSGLELTVLGENLGPMAEKLVDRVADEAVAAGFFEAPWKTGNLARSVVKEVSGLSAVVKPLAPYAAYVIAGTVPHEIRPVNARCLRFVAAGGNVVFTQLVHHPGTKPNSFLERAALQAAEKVPAIFDELWQDAVDSSSS